MWRARACSCAGGQGKSSLFSFPFLWGGGWREGEGFDAFVWQLGRWWPNLFISLQFPELLANSNLYAVRS